MRRKVLIVEQTDTTRSVAEAVLRQNGYEVISVAEADRAEEVLEFARPDLLVVSADVQARDRGPFYEKLRQSASTASIPMLLFEPVDRSPLDYPDEVIIRRPFDPRDFLAKVSVFMGQADSREPAKANPLKASAVDDEFLDAALGLDRLVVTDSEVMDSTGAVRMPKVGGQSVQSVGLGGQPNGDDLSQSAKIESLMIHEDASQIAHKPAAKKGPAPVEGTGKLEILADQYGMADPNALTGQVEGQAHDYDWFINAMRTDDSPAGATPQQSVSSSRDSRSESGKLSISEPSAAVDPVTPGPGQGTKRPVVGTAGVEKFIDEFKREIEQLRADESDVVHESAPKRTDAKTEGGLSWDETLERLTAEQAAAFTREFAAELGRRVAEMVVAKIDSDKLLRMIKNEILTRRGR
jgi:CheY-like chemotaxis protein